MSAPPPGYSGDSILQTHGGTAEIVPVMGGGRVKKALYKLRKKRSRKGAAKQRNKATKKHKRAKAQEGGASNHYTLNDLDEYKMNKAMSIRSATIKKEVVPKEKTILPAVERDIFKYLKSQAKLWVRKLNSSVLLRSQLKPKVPTTDNIGCTFGLETIGRIVRYAPDRLCCVLSKETTAITLFPAVNGDVNTFLRIATYIEAQPKTDKNRVFIFSPPFLGVNLDNNKQIFDYFLYYKNTVSTSTNLWSFYILTEYSTQNIEAAKALSIAIRPNTTVTAEITNYVKDESNRNTTHPDTTLVTSIYSMLEPTYIIYPHNLTFPVSSAESIVASVGKISREEYNKHIAAATDKQTTAQAKLKAASELYLEAKNKHVAAAAEAWKATMSVTNADSALKNPQADINLLKDQIKQDSLTLGGMGASNTLEYSRLSTAIETKKADLALKEEKIKELNDRFASADASSKEKAKNVQALEAEMKKTLVAETAAKSEVTKAKNEYDKVFNQLKGQVDPEAVSTNAVAEQKGGLLFSAATKKEAILPAPYSGFDAAIKYIQTNDEQTKRGSIAYRAAVGRREPILDSMDYEEYNLLQAPPMNDHTIFTFTLKVPDPADVGRAEISEDLSAFVGSPTIVQNHVPDVSVSVGPQDYSIRSPVPDVINDWNNGLFSNDEANYLNAMKLSPKILMGAFPSGWKKPLSDHLSMITRSNCFKDSRLLLHADCQQAQAFVSRVLEYFMAHTNDILAMQKKQGDSYTKNIEKKFDALASKLAFENGVAGKDIFDPVAFIETFFPGKKSDGTIGVAGTDYLTSVNNIKVDTRRKDFEVSYSAGDKLGASNMQAIGRQLEVPDTFTESPGTEPNTYTWSFTQEHSEYEITSLSSRLIKTFAMKSQYSSDTPSTTFTIVHTGQLSEMDKSLLKKKLGGEFTETALTLLKMYSLEIPTPKTEQELQTIFDSIKNENDYNFTLVQNTTAGSDDVTLATPNLDLLNNKLVKVFSLALSSDPKKHIFADFSMDYPPGKTIDEGTDILENKYVEIAGKINGRPPNPLVLGGRYIFYEDE